ncbi:MAG: HAD family hydrolase [Polaromonas sp.]|uniref:HAD family hydrolase n=1 Tax=Polaromonas sp. TaxID=1869339 RepID=UPI002487EBA9|nr:HAD family hydrolase [Polaromonas sp.]MDI1270140.1 HAD family hydrolase [Polaromonas sp.]
MLDLTIIKAITLDLDDTLWPVWPVIEKAEAALDEWLGRHAPMTAALFANPTARHDIREQIVRTRPELRHNLSAIRREAIRLALYRSRENPLLAEEAFEVFFAARHEVTLFDDAMLALEFLSARYPVVALSNGNADIARIGLAPYFRAAISAQSFGVGKPDPRIFHAAAGAVDVQPHHVLHVGDDATLDVLGGLNAGMQTAWVNRADHLWTHDAVPHETVTSLTELCDLFRLADPQP